MTDTVVITARNLRRLVRVPTLLVFATVQPVLFVLLFTYTFGGAIKPPGVHHYIDYLLPGLFVLSIAFGASQTGVAIADDLATGMIDRFRTLPITRPAVLAGRTLADAIRNLFVLTLMTGLGYAIGYRFHAGTPRRPRRHRDRPAGRVRVLLAQRADRPARPRRRIRRSGRPHPGHRAGLHQLHLRTRHDHARLAARLRRDQPGHRHRRRPARPHPRRPHSHHVWTALAYLTGLLAVTIPAAVVRYQHTIAR